MVELAERLRESVDAVNSAGIVTPESDLLCGAALVAADEIERLRAALRAIAACDERDDMDVAMQMAREALGDE